MERLPIEMTPSEALMQVILAHCQAQSAALERIAAALEHLAGTTSVAPAPSADQAVTAKLAEVIAKAEEVKPEPVKAEAPADDPTPPWEAPAVPVVTLEELRTKVVKLASSGKRDEVKKIVNTYAKSVTEIPADKLPEVWAKLGELEG